MTRHEPPPSAFPTAFGRPPIRPLDPHAVNRIAAGEVVERPASAVKELVENALDAGATRVDVAIADGGRTLVRVADDGWGIPPDELPLALARHATSKTDGRDLLDIRSFGFRGEALASLAAAARLLVTSRAAGSAEAAGVAAEAGRASPVRPAALARGTVVEVRDLFFATPARLKFLRADRAEAMAVADALRRLAMAEPRVAFTLRDLTGGADRLVLRLDAEGGGDEDALRRRLGAVMGRAWAEAAIPVDGEAEGHRLFGLAGLPAEARGSAGDQHAFVNGRPLRDKLLLGAIRGAYRDVVAAGRHPQAALFLLCDPRLVDVNVHPAKAEVRFRAPDLVRALVVGSLRRALGEGAPRPALALAAGLLDVARAPAPAPAVPGAFPPAPAVVSSGFAEALAAAPAAPPPAAAPVPPAASHPLGAARAQLGSNWIVAEAEAGLVLVDAHAAHERLVYERLKAEARRGPVPAQALLVPLVVPLPEDAARRVLDAGPDLDRLGLAVEPFGEGAVALRSLPAALGGVDGSALLRDVADALRDGEGAPAGDAEDPAAESIGRRLDAVLARAACHGSVRRGRRLLPAEMDALLREMERTPNSGTCNHGRPTVVTLPFADIERLFGRR